MTVIKSGIALAGLLVLPVTSALAFDPHISINLGGPEVYADTAPPAPIVETQPASPGPDYVWVGGAWQWDGHHWGWDKGAWQRPPHSGMHYVPNHYEERGGHHVYSRGGWK